MANNLPNSQRRYKLQLNNLNKIEELLQEAYNETDRAIVEINENINKIRNSVDNLNDEPMDGKAKYAKAINDLFVTRDKSIGRKLDISKIMAEILKTNGDVAKAAANFDENALQWDRIQEAIFNEKSGKTKTEVYDLKSPKH